MAGININTNVAVPQQTNYGVELPSERLAREVPPPTPTTVIPPAEQEYFSGATTEAVPPPSSSPVESAPTFQFAEQNPEQPTILNVPQQEITPQLQGEELIRQQKRANYGNIDWDTREGLKEVFGESIKTAEEGAIWNTRNQLIDAATKQGVGFQVTEGKTLPNGMSGLNYIQNSLGLENNVQAANALTTAGLSLMQMLPATSFKDKNLSYESDLESLLGETSSSSEPKTFKEMEKELTPEQAAQFMGKILSERARAAKALNPNMQAEETTLVSNDAAGQVGINALLDSGLIQEVDKDGKKAIRLTPKGTELAWSSRGLVQRLAEGSGGRSQIFPATDTGEYQGVMKNIRRGDKIKPTISQEKFSKPTEVTEAQRIVGSIAKQIPTAKLTVVAMLAKLARQEVEQGVAQNEAVAKKSGAARLFNLDGKLPDLKAADTKIALETADRELKYIADNYKEGNLRFSTHWADNSTWRLYDDSVDANMQRSKTMRAIYVGTPLPIKVSSEPFRGLSVKEVNSFVDAIASNNWNKRTLGKAAEINFLSILGHIMAEDTDDKTPQYFALSVTPEKLDQWAQIGETLIDATRIISDQGRQAVADFASSSQGDFDVKQLPPKVADVIQRLITDPTFDRENFGFRIQGYIDAFNYKQAKQLGGSFTPLSTSAIDMNSAGRAWLALDIGNTKILERVGLIWNFTDDVLSSTQQQGNPRSLFVKTCIESSVDKVFNSSKPEVRRAVKDLFSKNVEDKEFTKSFSKKVLLTTDYGKAIQYHADEAAKFLEKNPVFATEFETITGYNRKEAIDSINQLYSATLNDPATLWQYQLPKDMVRTLEMLGTMFAFKGMMNDTIPLGGNMFRPTGDEVLVQNFKGDTKKIQMTKVLFDPLARAKDKEIKDIHGEKVHFSPDLGSAAANQIGPIFGQYRESMVMLKTLLALNSGKKASDMLFMQPVFDNFILDSQSFMQALYYANNKAVLEVSDWDMQTTIAEDFKSKLREKLAEISKLGTVFVDRNSKLYGIYSTLDREYNFINEQLQKPNVADRLLTDSQVRFKEALDKLGYVYEKIEIQMINLLLN